MSDAIHFAPFRLHLRQARLLNGDSPVPLRPKTFAVLVYLAQHRGELVTKRDLLDAVWKDIAVTDDMPRISVRELRRALGDDARSPRYIETVRGQGYRFIGDDRVPSLDESSAAGVPGGGDAHVGREAELEVLRSLVEDATRGRRRMALVTGEAGIGKTALLEAVLEELSPVPDDRTLLGRGQCIEQRGESEPYHPLLEVIADWCRGPLRETVTEALQTFAPTWSRELPWLVRDETGKPVELSSDRNGDRLRREFCALIEGLARATTVVLVLEDLHWCDEATLGLLRALAQRREPARLLLLGTVQDADAIPADHPVARLKEDLVRKQMCHALPLERFDKVLVERFLAQRFEDETLARLLAPVVHAQTGGNPFFVRAVCEYLVDEEFVKEIGGAWKLGVDPASIGRRRGERWLGIPGSIQHMVEVELERLSPRERTMLEAASLAGVDFVSQLVAAATDADLEEAEEVCDALARHGRLIRTSGETAWPDGSIGARYCFVQTVYREVLQQRVSPARRRRLHERIAARLEAGFPGNTDDVAGQLAIHCEGGGAFERAVHWLERAAEIAARRCSSRELRRLLSRALELLRLMPDNDERAERELRLQLALAPAVASEHGLGSPQVRKIYAEARDLGEKLGCGSQCAPAHLGLHVHSLTRGALVEAVEWGREWLATAQRESPEFIVDARLALGIPLYFLGELSEACDHLTRAVDAYDPAVHRQTGAFYGGGPVDALCYLAWTLWKLGRPVEASARMEEAQGLARRLEQPNGIACALTCGAWLRHLERDTKAALEMSEAAIALARDHDLQAWHEAARIVHSWALVDAGHCEEGLAEMRDQIRTAKTLGQHVAARYGAARFAEATARVGNVTRAIAQLEPLMNGRATTEERVYDSHLHRLHGNFLLSLGGRDEEAERAFRTAADAAVAQRARAFELQAVIDLARLQQRAGRHEEARARLAPVLAAFDASLESPDLRDGRRLLRELDA